MIKSILEKCPQVAGLLRKLKGTDPELLIGIPKIDKSAYRTPLLSMECANELLTDYLRGDQACMLTRFGSAELAGVLNYFLLQKGKIKDWNLEKINGGLFRENALFPNTTDVLERFSKLYLSCMPSIDALAVWYNYGEHIFHQKYFPQAPLFPLETFEPFRFQNPWSAALENKKVLVVLPFESSVKKQYEQRNLLFSNKQVLPSFDLTVYRPFNSYTDQPELGCDWFYYFDKMKAEIAALDFEVALIAAGPFGLPLAAAIKESGKKAIHIGGALQLLFGIKGSRWEDRPEFASFMNKHWIKPSGNEVPLAATKSAIDNSSYW